MTVVPLNVPRAVAIQLDAQRPKVFDTSAMAFMGNAPESVRCEVNLVVDHWAADRQRSDRRGARMTRTAYTVPNRISARPMASAGVGKRP